MDLSILKAASLSLASGANVVSPVSPMLDIRVKERQVAVPRMKRVAEVSAMQCVALFGERDAVTMNFLPMMLTNIAVEQAGKYVDYCRDHRLSQFKVHNRHMRRCIEEYKRKLRYSVGPKWEIYQKYYRRLMERVELDLFKAWCVYCNEANRQYNGCAHNEIPARLTFVRMLLTFVEDFDHRCDEMLTERLQTICKRQPDPQVTILSMLCIDLADRFGGKMRITPNMTLCIKVLAQRCRALVNDIIAEESAAEEAES